MGFLCSKPVCQWQYRNIPAHCRCAVCARPLSGRVNVSPVCARNECWHTFFVERVQATKLERQHALDLQVGKWLAPSLAAQVHTENSMVVSDDVTTYRITGIPANVAQPGALSVERREMLHAHLTAVTHSAFLRRDELANTDAKAPERYADDQDTPEMSAVVGAACTQCRGQCCRNGANHAYLTSHGILAHLVEHPQQSADEVVALYESYVPAQTLDPGCAYQGETGCALPRSLRSDTCNRYFCDAITDFKRDHVPGTPVRAFFVELGDHDPEEGMLATADFVQLLRRAPVV